MCNGSLRRPHDLTAAELAAGARSLLKTAGKQWELAFKYREDFRAALACTKRRWPNISAGAVLRLAVLSTQAALQSLRDAAVLIEEAGKRFDAEHADFAGMRAEFLPRPRTPGKEKAVKGQTNAREGKVLLSFEAKRTKKGQSR